MKEVVIIGGGVSGIMCAITIKEELKDKVRVVIVERLERVGKKILSTGNGRCNFSNINMIASKYNNPPFVAAILNNLTPEKLMEKFKEMGLISKVGSEGRVYPYTEMANSVLDILRIKMKSLGIIEKCNQEVKKIVYNEGSYFLETTRGFQIPADYIVIATGGKAAPILGSNGSGYGLVKPFKVKVSDVQPGLVGIKIDQNAIRGLSGIRTKANVSLYDKKQKIKLFEEFGEVQFKDDGISGIVVMQLQLHIARLPKNNNLVIEMDLLPAVSEEELYEMLLKRKEEYGMLENNEFLTGLFAKMLAHLIIRNCKLDLSGYAETLTLKEIKRIIEEIKSFKLEPKGFYSFDKAQITVGGIETSELDKKTLEIKKMPGAYACGEVLNIDGECGGYNIHFACASGYTVAQDIIKKCEE